MNIHIARYNHDTAWMLASSSFNTGKAFYKTCNMCRMHMQIFCLIIFFDITKSRFDSNRWNRTGATNIIASEKFFCIFMCCRLIISGKVQINIRYFITMETHKHCKRNIVPITDHLCTALRTCFSRQVKTWRNFFFHEELAVFTLWTAVMRFQRIDLCNIDHSRYKRRTDRTTGPNQITIVQRFSYELMCNIIQNWEPMIDNGIELHFQSVADYLRQIFTIPFVRTLIRHFLDSFFCPRYKWWIQLITIRNRFDFFYHLRNLIRIGYTQLISNFFTKILKFLEHFFCCPEIKRCLLISIRIILPSLQDSPQLRVLRMQKMHVTGSDSQLTQLFTKFINFPIMLLQLFDCAALLSD